MAEQIRIIWRKSARLTCAGLDLRPPASVAPRLQPPLVCNFPLINLIAFCRWRCGYVGNAQRCPHIHSTVIGVLKNFARSRRHGGARSKLRLALPPKVLGKNAETALHKKGILLAPQHASKRGRSNLASLFPMCPLSASSGHLSSLRPRTDLW